MARLARIWKAMGDTGRAMAGLGSYEAYIAHMATDHPARTPMTEVEFFDNRQKAQYGEGGKGGFRCC